MNDAYMTGNLDTGSLASESHLSHFSQVQRLRSTELKVVAWRQCVSEWFAIYAEYASLHKRAQ